MKTTQVQTKYHCAKGPLVKASAAESAAQNCHVHAGTLIIASGQGLIQALSRRCIVTGYYSGL